MTPLRLALLGAIVAILAARPGAAARRRGPVAYVVDPRERFGPKWRGQRPPRWPARARDTADRASSAAMLAAALESYRDRDFRRVTTNLAKTESSVRVGRPANNYDGGNIRAAGVFSWNTLATPSSRVRIPGSVVTVGWRTVRDPVDWTTAEEIQNPLKTYWTIWRGIRDRGGDARAAALGIRLWHRRPSSYKRYLEDGLRHGWSEAWARVDRSHAAVIERHLRGVV